MTRSELLRAAMAAKLDVLFRNRVYDIVRRVDLPPGEVFISVLGNTARRGYVLRERVTGEQVAVGDKLLRHIHDHYLAVSLPYQTRRRTPARPALSGAGMGSHGTAIPASSHRTTA